MNNTIARILCATLIALAPHLSNAAPNILLILGDDMGAETLEVYGLADEYPRTDTLSNLAANGVKFTHFWSQPVCSPTRATIMTGRYGFRTGVGRPINVGGPMPEPPAKPESAPYERPGTGGGTGAGTPPLSYGLTTDEFTLGHALHSHPEENYTTGAIGKWHLGDADNGWLQHPALAGIDSYEAVLRGIQSYFSWNKVVDGEVLGTTNYSASDKVDAAIDYIDEQGSEPWFLWLGFTLPHTPFHLPTKELWQSDWSRLDPDEDPHENPLPYFRAMIEAMDTEIGRLLDSIDPEVLANTYVIFLGDNGTSGDVVVPPYEQGKAKGSVYQGGINVPLIISGPGVVEGGTSDAIINSTDLFATIIAMAEIDAQDVVPQDVVSDSVNFLPVLSNPPLPSGRDWVYVDVFRGSFDGIDGSDYAIANERYKLIRRSGEEEFYDLVEDPYEHVNLLERALPTQAQSAYEWLKSEVTDLRVSEGAL